MYKRDYEFINRVDDTKYFLDHINEISDKNSVILLLGNSGIGKSAFTENIIKLQRVGDGIKVKIEEAIGKTSDGYCIEKIAKTLDEYSLKSNRLCTFKCFFNNALGDEVKKRNYEIISNAAINVFPKINKIIEVIRDKMCNLGEFDTNKLFNSGITPVILILKSYIEYVLKQHRIILNIENIHVVDKFSLKLIQEILCNTKSNLFVFEFTTSTENNNRLDEIRNFLRENVSYNYKEKVLSKLSFQDYQKIVERIGIEDILKKSYIDFNGNIRKLIDLEITLELDPSYSKQYLNIDNILNPTINNIKSLIKPAQFLLTAIIAHKALVPIDNFKFLYRTHEFTNSMYDMDYVLEKLERQKLIIRIRGEISIAHDSITKEILNDIYFSRYLMIAYKIWIDYYETLLNESRFETYSRNRVLSYLFYFYFHYQPKKLFSLLPDIKAIAINSIYPDTAIEHIESLRESISCSKKNDYEILDKINFSIVDIYYYLGVFDKAFEVLKDIHKESERGIAYIVALLDRLDKHEEALAFIDRIFLNNKISVRLELILKLFAFISNRSIANFEQCRKLFNQIYNNKEYHTYIEYGYFLRNSQIICSLEEGKYYTLKSIDFFKNQNLQIQEGHSWITLSTLNAWGGFLDQGFTDLKNAESLLMYNTLERHILFNNRAAILMYKGQYDSEIEDLLIKSRETALSSFDRISIYCNFLIFYCHLNDYQKCEEIVEMLEYLCNLQPDIVIQRISYWNIGYFYKKLGYERISDNYIDKARKIQEEIDANNKDDQYDEYWHHRFNTCPSKSFEKNDHYFLSKFDFELCFITYWHFEIPENIES